MFVITSWGAKKENVPLSLSGENSINYDLPESSSEVKDEELKNKLDAFRAVYGKNTDKSALAGLSDLEDIDNDFESSYSTEDERALSNIMKRDSINRALTSQSQSDLKKITSLINARNKPEAPEKAYASTARTGGDEKDEFNKRFGHLFNKGTSIDQLNGGQKYGQYGSNNSDPDNFEEASMRIFKQQMDYVDSMNQAKAMALNSPQSQYQQPTGQKGFASKNFQPNQQDREVLAIKYSQSSNGFNTVLATKKTNTAGIPAIIDEDRKGMTSTRIRLKLMSDMIVGDNLLKKGTYIYAFVSGFSTQRVMLTISQIMYKGENLNVNIDVYDNDGYMGLYVPNSVFREFTKEVGDQSTRGLSTITTSEDDNQLTQSLIKSLFSGGANATSSLIKANKAQFKYNYKIFLKENTQSKAQL